MSLSDLQHAALQMLAKSPRGFSLAAVVARGFSFGILQGLVRAGYATAHRDAVGAEKTRVAHLRLYRSWSEGDCGMKKATSVGRSAVVGPSSGCIFENHGDDCGDACGEGNLACQHGTAYEFAPEHFESLAGPTTGRPRPRVMCGAGIARPVTLRDWPRTVGPSRFHAGENEKHRRNGANPSVAICPWRIRPQEQ
jgi:hypothetical protein